MIRVATICTPAVPGEASSTSSARTAVCPMLKWYMLLTWLCSACTCSASCWAAAGGDGPL
jgi:hypothetical protein